MPGDQEVAPGEKKEVIWRLYEVLRLVGNLFRQTFFVVAAASSFPVTVNNAPVTSEVIFQIQTHL